MAHAREWRLSQFFFCQTSSDSVNLEDTYLMRYFLICGPFFDIVSLVNLFFLVLFCRESIDNMAFFLRGHCFGTFAFNFLEGSYMG